MSTAKNVVLFAGGEVGEIFLDLLLEAHQKGSCRLSALVPAGRCDARNASLRQMAATKSIPSFDRPENLLALADIWLAFSAGNSLLLSDAVLAAAANGIINFHAAPLPRFRGSAAPAFAIAEGVTDFGVTFHKMVAELDAGPIVLTRSFSIGDRSTAEEVNAESIEIGAACFRDNLTRFLALDFDELPNDADRAPYKRRDMEAFRKLNLDWPEWKIWNHVRACDWNGVLQPAYFEIDGKPIFVTAAARGNWL